MRPYGTNRASRAAMAAGVAAVLCLSCESAPTGRDRLLDAAAAIRAAFEPRLRVCVRGHRERRRILCRAGAAAQRRGRAPDLLGRASAVAVMDPRSTAGPTRPIAAEAARRCARAHPVGGRRLRRGPRRGAGRVPPRDDLGRLRPSRGQRPLRRPPGVHGSATVPGGAGERHGTREPGDGRRRPVRCAARQDRRVRPRAGVVAHRSRGRPAPRLPLGGGRRERDPRVRDPEHARRSVDLGRPTRDPRGPRRSRRRRGHRRGRAADRTRRSGARLDARNGVGVVPQPLGPARRRRRAEFRGELVRPLPGPRGRVCRPPGGGGVGARPVPQPQRVGEPRDVDPGPIMREWGLDAPLLLRAERIAFDYKLASVPALFVVDAAGDLALVRNPTLADPVAQAGELERTLRTLLDAGP